MAQNAVAALAGVSSDIRNRLRCLPLIHPPRDALPYPQPNLRQLLRIHAAPQSGNQPLLSCVVEHQHKLIRMQQIQHTVRHKIQHAIQMQRRIDMLRQIIECGRLLRLPLRVLVQPGILDSDARLHSHRRQ